MALAKFEPEHEHRMAILWLYPDGRLEEIWRIDKVEGLDPLPGHDKNWVHMRNGATLQDQKISFVYKWEPLAVIELDLAQRTAALADGYDKPVHEFAPDIPRGSTPIIAYGKHYLALVHNHDYQHQIIMLDQRLNVLARSDYFTLDYYRTNPVEFCCDMMLDGSKLWIVWSENDACIRRSYIDRSLLDDLFNARRDDVEAGKLEPAIGIAEQDLPVFSEWVGVSTAVPMGACLPAVETGEQLKCNASAARVLALCDGSRSIRQISETIAETLDNPPEDLHHQVLEVVSEFRRLRTIK